MRVPINLASRPADAIRPLRMTAISLGLLALVLAAVAVRAELQSRDEFRVLVDRTSQLQGEVRELEAAQQEMEDWLETPQVAQIRNRSALLNSLIEQKSLSWTRLFQDLETTLPSGVRILSIAPKLPDMNQAQLPLLNLAVVAESVRPLVDFVKKLEDSSQFANPVVLDQRFPVAKETGGEIELSLTAVYSQDELPAPLADEADDVKEAEEAEDAEEAAESVAPPAPIQTGATAVIQKEARR
ncbi:MAG: hypothetical protein EXQ56_07465 [Acidobacteria bacterium]|nr:hypothetical protein [Acidobacteriota bacterium]